MWNSCPTDAFPHRPSAEIIQFSKSWKISIKRFGHILTHIVTVLSLLSLNSFNTEKIQKKSNFPIVLKNSRNCVKNCVKLFI